MSEHTAWLQPALQYVRDWMQHQMRVSEQPGCSIAVGHSGSIVLEASFGSANLKTGEKLTPQHRLRVASHSKTFTATAFMRLREQGAVRLDDPVGRYVKDLHPQVLSRTVAQLLSNTAGIFRDGLECSYWLGWRAFPEAAELRNDLQLPPTIEPSSRLKYSNHGYGLAGLVIEAIVGEPYSSWINREIIQAIGLRHTTPDITPEAKAALAQGHSNRTALGRRIVYSGDQPTGALASATGFVSTAADLCRFFGQLSPKAETSLLSPESRREMVHGRWKDPFSPLNRWYGLGTISGRHRQWDWFGHSGAFQGYITQTAVVPEQNLTVSVLTNAADGKAREWLEGILSILQRFQAAAATSKVSADWSGRWWSEWGAVDLVPLGAKVLLAAPDQIDPLDKASELTLTSEDEAVISEAGGFMYYGERVTLRRDSNRRVASIQIGGGSYLQEEQLLQELRTRYPE